ncbi:hypothetical protein OG946_00215 [Streptomyces sp. NBC_01808]|uniref:hypothetical protein n=1 Tax=Streptomyces sp. NBC_01808 TaxID=2975947 RepID=UPI002DDA2B60|nr:hypothetical protein [Streptomyces sp. NBC_01808]WSA35934.1 hypothetical protein OG946_00215 [Streptomyces sp. NBC_01808]
MHHSPAERELYNTDTAITGIARQRDGSSVMSERRPCRGPSPEGVAHPSAAP